jgi:hypothetical protein
MRYVIFDTQADEGKEYIGIDFVRTDDIDKAEHFGSWAYAELMINQRGTSSMIVIDTYNE